MRLTPCACGVRGSHDVSPLPCALRADKITGSYIVRYANGQALMHIYSRDSEAEALQAKVLTKDEARWIAPTSRGCRSCLARMNARREWVE